MEINPVQIESTCWSSGYALDTHTRSSFYLGEDAAGHPHYDTTRSPIGELLYQLKYHDDQNAVDLIAKAAATFLQEQLLASHVVDRIVPVPPSTWRRKQPVQTLALAIGGQLDIACVPSWVERRGSSTPAKSTLSLAERVEQQRGAFRLGPHAKPYGLRFLVVDDLYQTGASAEAVAALLLGPGQAADVFYLAITRTRTNPT